MRFGSLKTFAVSAALVLASIGGVLLTPSETFAAKTVVKDVSHSSKKDCELHRNLLTRGNKTVIRTLAKTAGVKNYNKITIGKCYISGGQWIFKATFYLIGLPNTGN